MAQLRVTKIRRISRLSIEQSPMTMGRSSENTVVLPHTAVSREHCVIELIDGAPNLRDLGSRHGTRLNGRRIDGVEPLYDGDRIGVGPFEVQFTDPARAKRPGDAVAAGDPTTDRRDEALRQLQDTVERQQAEADARRAELERLEADLARREAEVRESATRHEESTVLLRAEVDRLNATLDETRGELERAREAATTEEHRVRELEAELNEGQEAQSKLERELEDARQRHEKLAERSRRDLEAKALRLEEAVALGASLKDRIAHLEQQAESAGRSCDRAEESLRQFEAATANLLEHSRSLDTRQRALQSIEAEWTQANEWLEQADRSDLPTLRHLIQQRDAVGERLELAHAQRDQAIAAMQKQIEALEALTAQERREWELVVRRTQSRSFLSGLTRRFG